jgi:hypothetical protein
MTQRWSAPLCLSAAAMLHCSAAKAGVWGSDPVLGVTGDYASNPVLLDVPHTAEADGAILLDAPTTYYSNDLKLSVLPSFRVGDTRSYNSVNSDYEHLTAKGEFDTERSVWTASAGVSRDSSLYQNYLVNGQSGVRRDGVLGDLNWDKSLTERIDFDTDLNWIQVRYAQASGTDSLVDYKYASIAPTLAWTATERVKLTFSANAGLYQSLDGTTRSLTENLQVGFVRALTELWSLTANAGYSRSQNRIAIDEEILVFDPFPQLVFVPVRLESSQNSYIYSASTTRQTERLTLSAIASRQEIPTGFAFLSRQNLFELKAGYALSERWSLNADAQYLNSRDPDLQKNGLFYVRTIDNFGLNASWQWTEHWTLTLGALRVTEHYASTNLNLDSNQVSITLSRKFNHLTFQ